MSIPDAWRQVTKRVRRSLRVRVLCSLVAVATLLSVSAGVLVWWRVHTQLSATEYERAQQRATALLHGTQTVREQETLQRLVYQMAAERDVEHVIVAAGEPLRIVAASRGAWLGRLAVDISQEGIATALLSGGDGGTTYSRHHMRAVKRFVMNSYNGALPVPAVVLVDSDFTVAAARIETQATRMALLTFLFLVTLGIITHVLLKRLILDRLEAVQQALARRVSGDLAARVHWSGEDEVADLAREVNQAFDAANDARTAAQLRQEELERSVAALAASEARFQTLLESLPHHVWTARGDGRCDYHNARGLEYLGVTLEELQRNGGWSFIHPDDRADAQAAWQSAIEMGGEFRIDYRLKRADGVYRWFHSNAVPLKDEAGAITKWFGTDSDITERRREEEQLRQSQKLEAIGQLTGGLAHDFNNLLGIVVGNLDLMGTRLPDDERLHSQHRTALNAALRGAEVTRGLLAVARRQPLEPKPHDLNALLEEMLPLLRAAVGSAVALRTQWSPARPCARLDPAGLSNVALNLLINARDALAGNSGERLITMRTHASCITRDSRSALTPGWYAVLEVIDNGCGMTDAVRSHAFEPFFTTKERGKGTGLGLSMVHGYAEQLGGTAEIESTAGAGTIVRIYLPMQTPAPDAQAAEEARLAALDHYQILDTPPEAAFDALTDEAARMCAAPIALISLVDSRRQWFKARTGLSATQTPREDAFCAYAIQHPHEIFLVPDARKDPRFCGNPLVLNPPHVCFYAGVPLVDTRGHALGTLCVIDHVPRELDAAQLGQLERLAQRAVRLIEQRGPGASAEPPPAPAPAVLRVLVVDDEPGLCDVACDWLEALGYVAIGVHSAVSARARLAEEHFDVLFTDVVMPGSLDGLALAREAIERQPGLRVLLTSGYAQSLLEPGTLPGRLLNKPYRKNDLNRALLELLHPHGERVTR